MTRNLRRGHLLPETTNKLPETTVCFETTEVMEPAKKLLFDFSDLPQNHAQRQMMASEQLATLCGLGRRGAKRIAKALLTILSNFPPESLICNAVYQLRTTDGWKLSFEFESGRLSGREITNERHGLKGLRRFGEKLSEFRFDGSPEEGFEISFSELLSKTYLPPTTSELKQWKKVIIDGDWESAFNQISRLYQGGREKNRQLKDGLSIQRDVLKSDKGNADVVLSLVASKTDNAVMILDGDANLEWFNQAFSGLTGASLPDHQKQPVHSVLFVGSAEKHWPDFQAKISEGSSFQFSHAQSITTDEAEPEIDTDFPLPRWFEFHLTPILDEYDIIVRWIGIGSDVTQRRQAELAMQAAKEIAESASRAKSDFLAMMSHEIRTPMNAILGMTELTLGTNLTIDQREYLTTANNSAQALLQILNDILDLSKVEAQRLELEKVDFNVADLTRETLDTLTVLAQRKDLALRCNFPLDIHQQLVGDPMRLRQILVNLVGNAIKFTSFGYVEVTTDLLDETTDSVTLQYSVKDTGVGIPADKTSRIFEAFFQSDAAVSRNFGGTGLGLAITSELVRLMGGRIWVESKLGKGSVFHVVVTMPKSKRTFVSLASTAGRNLTGKKLLIVDDNLSNQVAMNRWLKHWDVDCQFATTASEGLNLYQNGNQRFDLAILDVILPDMNGFDLAQTILRREANGARNKRASTPPILMFSSDDRTETVERCRDLGIQHYLIKPVSPKTLHTAIQLAMGELGQESNQSVLTGGIERTIEPLNILIVDDHASNRKLMGEILRRRGHNWRETASGQQAIETLTTDSFNVVLMDVQMPEKDGLQTTIEIRNRQDDSRAVPIIAVTAYVTEDDRQRCLDAGMSDYLAKPVDIHELLEKVERWGHTVDGDPLDGSESSALDDQLLIQDAPDWATQITQTIVVAEESQSETESSGPLLGDSAITDGVGMLDGALARFGGDKELLQMQIGFFLQEVPELLANIQKALATQDSKLLLLSAHRLKGQVKTYDDDLAAELASRLELAGKNEFADEPEIYECESLESVFALLIEKVDELTVRLKGFQA